MAPPVATDSCPATYPGSEPSSPIVDSHKSLPAQWYRDERIYHIERRAIFSKLWILSTHVSRFQKPGDYIKLELAGYSYFVIMTKEGNYVGLQNVCRHRAFPLVHKDTGSSTVIGCKYHGWSYSPSTGALIKAPKFNMVPTFKPAENSLFRIRTHVTSVGFIFVNFAANIDNDEGVPPVPTETDMPLRSDPSRIPPGVGDLTFEDHFGDLVNEWSQFKPLDYEYAYSWTVDGAYNWKTLMDGYQECYHCAIAHPGFAKSLALDTYKVTPKSNFARHTADNNSKPNAVQPKGAGADDAPPTFTFVFPSCGVTVTDVMWYMMRVIPLSATQTRMEYDVFKRKSVSMERLKEYMQFYEQVEEEDYLLCVATQRNLNTGIYSRGALHPDRENGVLYYQSRVKSYVEEHLALEKQLGYEWNPAQPQSQCETNGIKGCGARQLDLVCSSLGPEMTW
ncbi:choline monooxygenase [Ceratobasidium sp. AG-Ba]|nr:choline monooxygenase [Ceratobasidium sp. AG-Ba]